MTGNAAGAVDAADAAGGSGSPPPRAGSGRRDVLKSGVVLLLVTAALFGLAEVWFAFGAYFTLGGSTPDPPLGELVRIDVCAAVSVGAATLSVVLSLIIRGRWGLLFAVLGGIGMIVAILLALVITSPQVDWRPGPEPAPDLPSNYQPCYSGSGKCN
ncbi:DUF6234 family protein [Subtercola boreus]|uniref:DUF6234 domain-containing protein n=1 Tax=Subtercola boreus TaxID=120213 RepID=A0A3E0WDJ2_9MICO|nr:DUF6234 family protein [Subtercola boreus]RFA21160.1 hypothetical protein B7R24_07150 [Subtercola boreus]RFA21543.1 hypothetical protein B7R23_07095 [Subtercola boreus]RFA27513.1 hypothetical protein B7R25_07220 [Subtercola boreus]